MLRLGVGPFRGDGGSWGIHPSYWGSGCIAMLWYYMLRILAEYHHLVDLGRCRVDFDKGGILNDPLMNNFIYGALWGVSLWP